MHAVGLVIGIPENEIDSRLEMFLEDYRGDDCYYTYYDTGDEYETLNELLQDHPEVRDDCSLYGTVNPYSQCDYYTIGGRWEGYFLLKNGERANSTTIGEIDFDKMEDDARKLARQRYQQALEAIGGDKNFKSFDRLLTEYSHIEQDRYSKAREAWMNQKPIKDWYKWRSKSDVNSLYFDFNIDDVLKPVADYEDKLITYKLVPVAVIHDDYWEELPTDVKGAMKWLKHFRAMPKDTPVTMIDYHV